jgi:hypothetical protein
LVSRIERTSRSEGPAIAAISASVQPTSANRVTAVPRRSLKDVGADRHGQHLGGNAVDVEAFDPRRQRCLVDFVRILAPRQGQHRIVEHLQERVVMLGAKILGGERARIRALPLPRPTPSSPNSTEASAISVARAARAYGASPPIALDGRVKRGLT